MTVFLQHIFTFPTVIFTVFLGVLLVYLLVAIVGLADLDFLDLGVDIDTDTGLEGLAGLMVTLGLSGVPSTIAFALLGLTAWLVSYFLVHFLFFWSPGHWFNIPAGILVIVLSVAASIPVTARVIRWLRPIFKKAYAQAPQKALLGVNCRIRSLQADAHRGEAVAQLDGAELIIKVRSHGDEVFAKGDVVRIAEHDSNKNIYTVVRLDTV